jgi:hypothetical protein
MENSMTRQQIADRIDRIRQELMQLAKMPYSQVSDREHELLREERELYAKMDS